MAVSIVVSPFHIQKVNDVKIIRDTASDVSFDVIADIILRAATRLDGVIVTEPGEFYNQPEWRVEAALGRKFKYAESIGERRAIEVAHHISLAVHRMLQE